MASKSLVGIILGVFTAIVLVATLTVPIIDELTEESSFGWVYDDYRVAPDGCVVSGVFELVDYGGVTYIHANDVGEGTIDGETVTVSKADLAVFLLWGQSNSMYLNADVDQVNEDCDPLKTRAYFYGIDTDDAYRPIISWKNGNTAVYPENGSFLPTCAPDGTYLIGNIEAPFSAGYCENIYNYRPYIINAGVGGMSLQSFLPGTIYNTNTHNIWTAATSLIDTDKFNVHYEGWIMSQGEANSGTAIETYIGYFDEVVADIEDSFNLNKGAIIQTREGNSARAHDAQIEIVETHPNVIMGSTASSGFTVDNGCLASDGIHYTQKGDDIVGTETAAAWLSFTQPLEFDYSPLLMAIVPLLIISIVIYAAVIFLRSRY